MTLWREVEASEFPEVSDCRTVVGPCRFFRFFKKSKIDEVAIDPNSGYITIRLFLYSLISRYHSTFSSPIARVLSLRSRSQIRTAVIQGVMILMIPDLATFQVNNQVGHRNHFSPIKFFKRRCSSSVLAVSLEGEPRVLHQSVVFNLIDDGVLALRQRYFSATFVLDNQNLIDDWGFA